MVFGRMNRFGRSSEQEAEAKATQSEAEPQNGDEETPSSLSDRPGIADKVKFWEEQDRINRELIPRVLRQNELLSAHVASHEDVRVQTTTMNARIEELAERHTREMRELEARTGEQIRSSIDSRVDEMIEFHKRELAELEARTGKQIRSSIDSRVDEITERYKREMAELEARTAAEVRSSNRFAIVVSMASAGIAALAVVMALVT